MYQQEMFTRAFTGATFLGEGHVAVCHDLGNGFVCKYAKVKDETLNYLEWCVNMTAGGNKLSGMPNIDRLILLEEGYLVYMHKYQHWRESPGRDTPPKYTGYLAALIEAYREYMEATFGVVPIGALAGDEEDNTYYAYTRNYADDCHDGNIMWCGSENGWILTDPSARSYLTLVQAPPLELQ